jgi:hypothetical protein
VRASKGQREAISQMSPQEREQAHGRLQGETYVSHAAVKQQADRLRGNHQPGAEWMADQRLFAEALRWVLRGAEGCALLADEAGRKQIANAVADFKKAIPSVVEMRDALEHFDDYIIGVGRRSRIAGEFSHLYTRGKTLHLKVGPMTMDVEQAELAATALASTVLTTKPS